MKLTKKYLVKLIKESINEQAPAGKTVKDQARRVLSQYKYPNFKDMFVKSKKYEKEITNVLDKIQSLVEKHYTVYIKNLSSDIAKVKDVNKFFKNNINNVNNI
jgi:hypothetical protein